MKKTLTILKITLIHIFVFISFFAFSQCNIDLVYAEITACEGDFFDVSINFEYENTSDQFTISGNGTNYGTFNYSDLPISLTTLPADCETSYEFVVTDVNDNDCTDFVEWGVVCCSTECALSELMLSTSECDGDVFSLTIDFEYEGNTSSMFDWEVVGVADGTAFFADLPLTVQIFNATNDILGFVVTESGNPNCGLETSFDNPCVDPPCEIFDLVIETSECDGGFFDVTFDFEYSGTTNNFFDWEIPGLNSGFAEFSDLPLTINIENSSISVFDLIINENDNPDCADIGTFINPCFESNECFIGELSVVPSECQINTFLVTIDFEYENTSDEFFVNSNGENYGPYLYTNLPIVIAGFDADCETVYEFLVYDSEENGTCEAEANIGTVCCNDGECEIISLDFSTGPDCVDGFIVTEWLITAVNTSEVGFDIFINNEFLLFVEYNETDWYDFDIPDPETDFFTIKVCDNDNEDCCYTWELENPCYSDCFIGDINTEILDCENGVFDVQLNFEYEGTGDQFTVVGNGANYGSFSYNDLPITISGLEGDCSTEYEFIVSDMSSNNCSNFTGIGTVCCSESDCDFLI